MQQVILVLNAGSSSIKFALYESASLTVIRRGAIEKIGLHAEYSEGEGAQAKAPDIAEFPADGDHDALMAWLLAHLRDEMGDASILAVGHRVVHGGRDFAGPAWVDADVRRALEALTPLAPNHQPQNLAAIDAVAKTWPDAPQLACFDTSFHRSQPRIAQLFALPRVLSDEGVLRYGFHGLSYEYIAERLPELIGEKAKGRVIVAHLGHGASMCAMREGRSIATTMGFTALDGLVMGKRCGALDPGVILYLMGERGMSIEAVNKMLNRESGLLGVSGVSDDVRTLIASDDPHAREALELFVYRAAREIGALVACLGGLDALVFTAGIGEHAAFIRREICARSQWTGLVLDEASNEANATFISAPSSKVTVLVVPTNEELPIARAVVRALAERAGA